MSVPTQSPLTARSADAEKAEVAVGAPADMGLEAAYYYRYQPADDQTLTVQATVCARYELGICEENKTC